MYSGSMKGGDCVDIRISKKKLDAYMKARGFEEYGEIEETSRRDHNGDVRITSRTIYNMLKNKNWTRDSLLELCRILDVRPEEILDFTNGDDTHTHVSPQPDEAEKEQVEAAYH